MRGYAVALLCFFAVAQALDGNESSRAVAVQGENPWIVHLRIAVSVSGLLSSSTGSFINEQWVLTSASSIAQARFIWVRFGVVDVLTPSLVIETSLVRIHGQYSVQTGANNIALVAINPSVKSTVNYRPISIALPTAELPETAKLCGFGVKENGDAGEQLKCMQVQLETPEGAIVRGQTEEGKITGNDIGAPLVSNNVQIGILVNTGPTDQAGSFLLASQYREWIEKEAGISLDEEEPESTIQEVSQVNFVN